jgi:uncharacterized membrane protein YfcA
MELSLVSYAIISTVLLLGGIVQCAVGFASGLLVTPILLMFGWNLQQAIAIQLVAGAVQNLSGALRLRHAFDWHTGLRPNLIRLVFMPAGVAVLVAAKGLDPAIVKQMVGALILLFLILLVTGHIRPRKHLHVAWEWLAMSTGGFLLGFCGMGGPPIVMWITAQGWAGDKARAFMFHAFTFTLLPMGLLLVASFGREVLDPARQALLAIPWSYLGAMIGLRLGAAMPDQRLRRITFGLLATIAVTASIGPWL